VTRPAGRLRGQDESTRRPPSTPGIPPGSMARRWRTWVDSPAPVRRTKIGSSRGLRAACQSAGPVPPLLYGNTKPQPSDEPSVRANRAGLGPRRARVLSRLRDRRHLLGPRLRGVHAPLLGAHRGHRGASNLHLCRGSDGFVPPRAKGAHSKREASLLLDMGLVQYLGR